MSDDDGPPEVYRTRHHVSGMVPAWCEASYSARSDGLPAASGWTTIREVEEVDAELSCVCGESFDSEHAALEHIREVGAEVLEVREDGEGNREVIGRHPAGGAP